MAKGKKQAVAIEPPVSTASAESVREVVSEIARRGGVDDVFGRVSKRDPCQHLLGFPVIGKGSADGVTVLDLTRCSLCRERRLEAANSDVVASRVAGGEWRAW